jgi:RNA polymerase sigma-70 factor, ECF subfamily
MSATPKRGMLMAKTRQECVEDSATDVSRLEQWMEEYGQDVLHLAYSYVRNYQHAEDVAQDVFLRAWHKYDTFQGNSSIKTWLLSITANRAKDFLRSWSAKHEVTDDGSLYYNISSPDSATQVTERLERDRLWDIVHQLPEKYREVVILYYGRELTGQEIALVLGISEQSVRTRLHRGRQLLKSALSKEEEGFDGISRR